MPLINQGEAAPDFELKDQNGKAHRLSAYRGGPVVLFFYPKDMTTGCTLEARDFERLGPEFEKIGVPVFAASILDEKSKKQFADKEGLHFPMLSDKGLAGDGEPDPKVCREYGVWVMRKSDAGEAMGVSRTTYLIDGEGKVARRWDNVDVEGHAEEVLEEAKALA